ncbi:MAG: tRNA (cytidine/uridine-2'-O-)-methyltransferase [Alphaproteobacteria bacterium]|jgi:tRNA (cytidine/uridine-2'-O-)-methyltransferase
MNIVLYQTDMAQNFGTIVRTAVTLGVTVHVVEPLGFVWDEPKMRRAGMDYLERADIKRHKSWTKFLASENENMKRLVAVTTKGSEPLHTFKPQLGDYYIFGQESAGLPDVIHEVSAARIIIPMVQGERSMNIAVSCGIVMYDVLNKNNLLPKG